MPDTNINRFGKTSTLRLSAASKDGKTIIDDVYFTSPYKILPPFYNDNSRFASTMIISVSAGLMEGDRQDVFINAKENANLLCTSQAFEKIHKMNNGEAGRNSLINAYIGDELVFFDNTRYSPRKSDLNGLGMFENHSHLATVLLLNFDLTEQEQSSIYEKINENPEMAGGISAIEHGFIIKILGKSAQQLQNVTNLLKNILNIL